VRAWKYFAKIISISSRKRIYREVTVVEEVKNFSCAFRHFDNVGKSLQFIAFALHKVNQKFSISQEKGAKKLFSRVCEASQKVFRVAFSLPRDKLKFICEEDGQSRISNRLKGN
jgi:hypothetical protein